MSNSKEALIYCLDIGSNVLDPEYEHSKTFFDLSQSIVEEILQRKIFSLSKDEISLVTFNGPHTNNYLDFIGIDICREFDIPDFHLLKFMMNMHVMKDSKSKSPNNQTYNGSFLEALTLCQDMLLNAYPSLLDKQFKNDDEETDDTSDIDKPKKGRKGKNKAKLKLPKSNDFERRIILFTNFKETTSMHSLNSLKDIILTFRQSKIKMNIIGLNLENVLMNINQSPLSKMNRFSKSPKQIKLEYDSYEDLKASVSPAKSTGAKKLSNFKKNMAILRVLIQECNKPFSPKQGNWGKNQDEGETITLIDCFTFSQVLNSIKSNQTAAIKITKPMPLYNMFRLSNDLLSIPIRGYYRIKKATFSRTWKRLQKPQKIREAEELAAQEEMKDFIVGDDDYDEKDFAWSPSSKKRGVKTKRKELHLPCKRKPVILDDELDYDLDEENEEIQLKFKPDYIKAYKYGSTLVPFSAEDEAAAQNLPSEEYGAKEELPENRDKTLSIIGFTKFMHVSESKFLGDGCLEYFWDETCATKIKKDFKARKITEDPEEVAQRLNRAFECLVYAMFESELVGIARFISTTRGATINQPKVVILTPRIKPNYICLILNVLPFLEDIRLYKFPNFLLHQNVSHERRQNHKNIESEKEIVEFAAIDKLVDTMDLMPRTKVNKDLNISSLSQEISSEASEIVKPKYTPNPYFNQLVQALSRRAIQYIANEPPTKVDQLLGIKNKKLKSPPKSHKRSDQKEARIEDIINGKGCYLEPVFDARKVSDLDAVFKQIQHQFPLQIVLPIAPYKENVPHESV